MTLAIALWGAIVATVVGIVQILHWWGERARMRVDRMSIPVMPIGTAPPELEMDVTNLGPEPMTIRTAGFIGASIFDTEPVVIPPHEIRRLRQPCRGLPLGAHLEFPLSALVVDAHSRVW